MSAFLAIVKLTCKSIIRSHIFQLLLFILLVTIIALPLTVVGDGTALAQIQVSLKYCLGAVSFILSLSSIWLGCFIMSKEIESYQIHMVICKPVSRLTIWLGKFTGVIIIHSILLFISALLVYILVLCQFQDPMFLKYTQLPLGLIMGLSGLVLILILFIWLNRSFLKFFRVRFIKSDEKKEKISGMLLKSGLSSFGILIIASCLFFALQWQFNKDTFSLQEKTKIKNEVLVGRRVFMPMDPDIDKAVQAEYEARVSKLPMSQRKKISEFKRVTTMFELKKQFISQLGELRAGNSMFWVYEGLEPGKQTPLFLRYRTYIGKISTKKQRETMGIWGTRIFIPDETIDSASTKKPVRSAMTSKTSYPEKIMCGVFNETVFNRYAAEYMISPEGKVVIGFRNFDPQRKTIFFQTSDGPKLLIKKSSFINNYCRSILVIFFKLAFLTALACSIGGLVSAPIGILSIIAYLLVGSMTSYLKGVENQMLKDSPSIPTLPFFDQLGSILSKLLNPLIIPMQNFEVSQILSGGELIEWDFILRIIFYNIILRGLPLILLGLWLFKRREMGLVKKT